VLFGKLQKGGIVRVTVEDKAEGGPGLKLECIPDENATRKERPPKVAGPAEEDAIAPVGAVEPAVKPAVRAKKPKGGGSVPRVPLKA
jgi:ATP-dependent Clp protease ATP-binding subunit ClpA